MCSAIRRLLTEELDRGAADDRCPLAPQRIVAEWKMNLELGHSTHVHFGNPDLVAYAESFGARGHRITAADELLPTPRDALARDGVDVITCPVDYRENVRLTDRLGELTGPF